MSTTRPRKDSTVLAPIDISDQPIGLFVMLTEGATGTQAFSVDKIEVKDEVVYGYKYVIHPPGQRYLSSPDLIVAMPVRSPWGLISRDVMVVRTLEESIRKQKVDKDEEATLLKEVFGDPKTPQSIAQDPKLPLMSQYTGEGLYK